MNRNTEAHFTDMPDVELSRSTFDRSCTHTFTFNAGDLIPFYIDEVLPGDTFKVRTSKVLRLQTLLTPIMDNLYLDTYYFFVPNRLVWNHWKEFCGENNTSAWLPSTSYSIPQFDVTFYTTNPSTETGALTGSVFDYMGIPVETPGMKVNALPIRAYSLIWNEFFRDQNLQDPLAIYTGDAERKILEDTPDTWNPAVGECSMFPHKVNKYHDYFTSCLPAPQKGPDVSIPLQGLAPVGTSGSDHVPVVPTSQGNAFSLHMKPYNSSDWTGSSDREYMYLRLNQDSSYPSVVLGSYNNQTDTQMVPSNLWADLGAEVFGTISALRMAFQIQKFYERDLYGTRYIELLKSHFGVTSSDARLQRPEYLGGNRIPLTIHQVLNNSQGANSYLGDLGAMSHTTDVHEDFVKSFEEHGFVIGVCCVRYDHTYSQGVDRFWLRKDKLDYYWPVFANISNQPVYRNELYVPKTAQNAKTVFGYNEAWADYRFKPNRVSGEMRPNISNSLATWNLADDYSSSPSLSATWMFESRANLDRTLAVTSSVSQQILADFYIENYCTRCMPYYSIPGLADHH